MSGPRRNQILRVLPAIHVNDTVVPGVAELMQPVDVGEPFDGSRVSVQDTMLRSVPWQNACTARLSAALVPESRAREQWKLP